jgi:MoxR-like ATPase
VIHLASAARASARLSGREEVSIEDVREIAPYVLRHRLILEEGRSADDVLRAVLEQVPVPERSYTLR